jgi:hypothetical protein
MRHTGIITPWSRVLLDMPLGTQLVKKFPPFMKPEALLLRSQEPASGPYPVPDESSPHRPTHFL